jgi:hypothetical protein
LRILGRRRRLEFRFSEIALGGFLKSEVLSTPSRAHHEGRIAIVTDVERDAMDVSGRSAPMARGRTTSMRT